MNILTEIHRDDGINIHGKTIYRTAVRAVILRGRELLMVYSANVGDYKFLGGGVDEEETHEQAESQYKYLGAISFIASLLNFSNTSKGCDLCALPSLHLEVGEMFNPTSL